MYSAEISFPAQDDTNLKGYFRAGHVQVKSTVTFKLACQVLVPCEEKRNTVRASAANYLSRSPDARYSLLLRCLSIAGCCAYRPVPGAQLVPFEENGRIDVT